jgi:hypothetical protein
MYAKKSQMSEEKLYRLWGNNYFDKSTNTWGKSAVGSDGSVLKPGFEEFVIEPIKKIIHACATNAPDLEKNLQSINVSLTKEERRSANLAELVLKKWLPLDKALNEVITGFPSPMESQAIQVEYFYSGI